MQAVRVLLRGGASLPFSFWVIGILGNAVFVISDAFLWEYGFYMFAIPEKVAFGRVFFAIATSYEVFSLFCIWNSASNYNGPKAWAALAKIMVVLWTLSLLLTMIWLVFEGYITSRFPDLGVYLRLLA